MISWLRNKLQNVADLTLVGKAKDGDREAFGGLYMKYIDNIYRYIFFRVNQNQQTAEDLSEVTFLKAWKNISSLESGRLNFRSWLYTIAHNVCIDHFRQIKNQVKLDENIEYKTADLEEKLTKEGDILQLQKAINLLTDEQKQIIIMKFINEMSNQEISRILHKKEDAIRALQHRALKKLREIMEK